MAVGVISGSPVPVLAPSPAMAQFSGAAHSLRHKDFESSCLFLALNWVALSQGDEDVRESIPHSHLDFLGPLSKLSSDAYCSPLPQF